MVGKLNRLTFRLVMLTLLVTGITMAVGLAAYYVIVYFQLSHAVQQMPPAARAELQHLIDTHQRGSDAYYRLYSRYGGNAIDVRDLGFISLIGLMSMLASGSVAIVMARRISRPIIAVAAAAERVSAGDRSARAGDEGAPGETGTLVRSFNRMASDIEAYERERKVFTAGIAHELRTPLTILKGRLHGLADGVIPPEPDEAVRLLRQVDQLSRLVEDLRTLAHVDAGELALDIGSADIAALADAAVADLEVAARAHAITIRRTGPRVVARCDPLRFTQILTNLLTNAIKHAPSGSTIQVATAREEGFAHVRVQDEGPGFLPEDAARLFIPFWRAGLDRKLGHPGSGLGLALAARLAEAQGGRIVAANRTDRSGALFSVCMPLD